jgi:hypothetical protein
MIDIFFTIAEPLADFLIWDMWYDVFFNLLT